MSCNKKWQQGLNWNINGKDYSTELIEKIMITGTSKQNVDEDNKILELEINDGKKGDQGNPSPNKWIVKGDEIDGQNLNSIIFDGTSDIKINRENNTITATINDGVAKPFNYLVEEKESLTPTFKQYFLNYEGDIWDLKAKIKEKFGINPFCFGDVEIKIDNTWFAGKFTYQEHKNIPNLDNNFHFEIITNKTKPLISKFGISMISKLDLSISIMDEQRDISINGFGQHLEYVNNESYFIYATYIGSSATLKDDTAITTKFSSETNVITNIKTLSGIWSADIQMSKIIVKSIFGYGKG